jgi:hypothetical protein
MPIWESLEDYHPGCPCSPAMVRPIEWIEAQQELRSVDVTIPGPLAAAILDVSERWARQLVPYTAGTVQIDVLLEAVVRRLGPVEGSR